MRNFACLLVLAAGCVPADQTSVGGSAREKCRDVGYPDVDIDSLFILYETARDDEAPKSVAILGAQNSCADACVGVDCEADCFGCNVAIVDEVYDSQ